MGALFLVEEGDQAGGVGFDNCGGRLISPLAEKTFQRIGGMHGRKREAVGSGFEQLSGVEGCGTDLLTGVTRGEVERSQFSLAVVFRAEGVEAVGKGSVLDRCGEDTGCQRFGFLGESGFATGEDRADAEFHCAESEGAEFPDGEAVHPLIAHLETAGMSEMGEGGTCFSVLADPTDPVERGVEAKGVGGRGVPTSEELRTGVELFGVDAA